MKNHTTKTKRIFNASISLAEPEGRIIHLGWRIFLTLILTILLILLTILADPFKRAESAALKTRSAQSLSTPTVVAFYYTWFDDSTWTLEKLSDLPTQPYVSRDPAVMGRHIEQAQQAGIDAFLVAWYGPNGEWNQTEENLKNLLDQAASRNFRIGILFETDSPFFSGMGDVTAALNHALSVHAQHPAFLRADGRPLIFFWRPTIYTVDTWQGIRNQVDTWQGHSGYSSIWIGEGVDTSYLSVFDGHHLYSNTWNPPANLTGVNQKFAALVSQYSSDTYASKTWVATVMPGYNDVRVRSGGFVQDRAGGAYYDRSWQAAMASNPKWIVINSFNEWPEGSYIEPSVTYGTSFIEQTARWSRLFKEQSAIDTLPANGDERQSNGADLPSTSTSPTSTEAINNSLAQGIMAQDANTQGVVTVSLLNLRSNPSTDAQILDHLPYGTHLIIQSQQSEWLQVSVGEQSGWVYASMTSVYPPLPVLQAPSNQSNPEVILVDELEAEPYDVQSANGEPPVNSQGRLQVGATVLVTVSLLNMRSGPGIDQKILAQLPSGHPLVVEDPRVDYPEWIQVRVAESTLSGGAGLRGWVYASMVQ
ncbi:MAG: endo-1,3-alpha-glucanase family glycosylhydrolase [Chloroflexota bacterium]